jgi:dihydroorotase
MPDLIWIKNGRIIDPANGRDEVGDIYANEGRIVSSLSAEMKKRAEVINAEGLLVCPGLVDIHVHFREPGQTHKETIQTGSHAAAAGGFTSVICMPNTSPPADNAGTIQFIQDAIKREAVIRVYPTGCITLGMNGESLAPIGSLRRAGVVAITDDGECVQNNELMRRAVEYASMFALPVMDHCQDSRMTQGSVMNEGIMSTRLGLRGWPAAAEDIIVSRNVILSTHTGAHIHLQHITSATSVEIIRRAKQRKVNITAEATPHHLALTDSAIAEYNTNFKMNPPLRTEEDRQALIEGLREGTIDCVATDHAPHTDYEKDKEFDFAPNGVVGLETALSVTLQILHRECGFSLIDTISQLTSKPSEIMNLDAGSINEGSKADISIIDPDRPWTVNPESLHSKSANSPWLGTKLKGQVRKTLVEGKVVYADGQIVTE